MPRGADAAIGVIVSSVVKRARSQRSIDVWERLWGRVCGKRFAEHSRMGSYRHGVLVIRVDRSEWLYEMHGRRNDWLNRLKRYPAGRDIQQIVFRIGQL